MEPVKSRKTTPNHGLKADLGSRLPTHFHDEPELKACNNCALDIDGQVGYNDENLRAPDVFKMLTGKAPVGTVTAKLQRAASTDPLQVAPLYYVLVDGKGNHPFELQWTDNLLAPNGDRGVPLFGDGDAKVFAAAKGKGTTAWAETYSLTISVRIGLLKATDGTQYSVILSYNLDNLIGPYHLFYLDHGIPRSLFSTNLSVGASH